MSNVGTGLCVTPSASFTRPADTTAYASGDLVANDTTAANVVSMSFAAAQGSGGPVTIRRARIKKSGTSTTNASFRLHLFRTDPVALSSGIANGDNGVFSTKNVAEYLGAFDITVGQAFVDGAAGIGVPNNGTDVTTVTPNGATTIYGLLEARAAYTPANAEVFTVQLECTAH